MREQVFIDTNIFVYASLKDKKHAQKRKKAIKLLEKCVSKEIVVSTQVLNEFYSAMLKNGVEDYEIQKKLGVIINATTVSILTVETIK